MVWIVKDNEERIIKEMKKDNPNVIISHSSLKNWYYVLHSRFIFSSHASYQYLKFHQKTKMINLWHGMPLKKIGFDSTHNGKEEEGPDTTTIASNEFFQRCLSSAFRISPDKIKIVGLPRNDMLFEKSNILDSIVGKHSYNSIGIWMPTFRQTQYGDAFDTQLKDGDLDYWDEEILTKLNEHLSCTNSFLILKLHPADIFQKKTFLSYSNIAILKNKDTSHRDLYPLLGTMDYLISDYSSVLIDFDILGKPMAFIINDIEEYTNNRGFYFDNIKEILPGKIITQENELEEFIDHHDDFIIKTDDRFNKYKDCKNRERLTEILLQETNN